MDEGSSIGSYITALFLSLTAFMSDASESHFLDFMYHRLTLPNDFEAQRHSNLHQYSSGDVGDEVLATYEWVHHVSSCCHGNRFGQKTNFPIL